jgi:hypothetical protein
MLSDSFIFNENLTVDCKIYKISIIKQGKFEYIKGIIRSRKSKKDRHHQAKYMTEVHLGMVQQSTGGRNRKIACDEMTEDDYAALLCFPEIFCYVKSHRYQNHIHLPL